MYIVTAFIGKSGYNKKETSQLINAKSPDATPKDGSVMVSNNIVSDFNEKSNTKNEDPEKQYSFGGRSAKNADLSLFEKAVKMNDEGKSSEEIRQETRWFKSYDGKWRYEIDDSKMKFKGVRKSDLHRMSKKLQI